MAISKKTRVAVYKKFDGHCAYCGHHIAYNDMQVDHFKPQRAWNPEDSGTDDIENLMLTKKLYEDFQAFDSAAVSAGNQTATAIKASYVPLDLKTDKFESCVTRCIKGILAVAGLDDDPTYTRNQIINKQEEAQTVLLGAEYYDDEYITKKLLTILGDADQYEDLMKRKAAEELDRTKNPDFVTPMERNEPNGAE